MKRILSILVVVLPVGFLVFTSAQGGDKSAAFPQSYLPADAYKVLSERSINSIEAIAKADAKDAAERIEVEATVLVGYTLSVKNSGDADVGKMRGAAIKAVQAARNGELKKLTEFGKSIALAPNAATEKTGRKDFMQELPWMMEVFKGKKKGGEGLHADLHYQPKLKNLDGIEALIGALSSKKLNDENLAKVSKELPLLAYRVAVIGSITHEFAPAKGAGQWRDLASQMKSSAVDLAVAAQKKNAEEIQKAATSLESSCTQCHSAFKGKT